MTVNVINGGIQAITFQNLYGQFIKVADALQSYAAEGEDAYAVWTFRIIKSCAKPHGLGKDYPVMSRASVDVIRCSIFAPGGSAFEATVSGVDMPEFEDCVEKLKTNRGKQYKTRPAKKLDIPEPITPASHAVDEAVTEIEQSVVDPTPLTPTVTVVVAPLTEAQQAINLELAQAQLPQHDIAKLQLFYLQLACDHFGDVTEGVVFVSTSEISKLLEKMLDIPHRLGHYAAVYSSRIAPFAEKVAGEGRFSRGWNFHVKKVLDFIEGASKIPKLPSHRPNVIHLPPQVGNGVSYPALHEAGEPNVPPMDDRPVQVIVHTGEELAARIDVATTADFDLLEQADALQRQHEAHKAELSALEASQVETANYIAGLEEALVAIRNQSAQQQADHVALTQKVDATRLPPKTLTKLNEMGDRLRALLAKFSLTS